MKPKSKLGKIVLAKIRKESADAQVKRAAERIDKGRPNGPTDLFDLILVADKAAEEVHNAERDCPGL